MTAARQVWKSPVPLKYKFTPSTRSSDCWIILTGRQGSNRGCSLLLPIDLHRKTSLRGLINLAQHPKACYEHFGKSVCHLYVCFDQFSIDEVKTLTECLYSRWLQSTINTSRLRRTNAVLWAAFFVCFFFCFLSDIIL